MERSSNNLEYMICGVKSTLRRLYFCNLPINGSSEDVRVNIGTSLRRKRTNPGYVRLRSSAQIRVLESRRVLHNVYLILVGVKFISILDEFWLGVQSSRYPIRIHLILISILHLSVSSTHYEVLYGIPEHEFVRYFADGHNRGLFVCSAGYIDHRDYKMSGRLRRLKCDKNFTI